MNFRRVSHKQLAALATKCGFTLKNVGDDITRKSTDGMQVPFGTAGDPRHYGFMGTSGLPTDLIVFNNQYNINRPDMCKLFTLMLNLADKHGIAHTVIPEAFNLATGLRVQAGLTYADVNEDLLGYEACLQAWNTHGIALTKFEIRDISQRATNLAAFYEIIQLRGSAPDTLLHDMFPLVKAKTFSFK